MKKCGYLLAVTALSVAVMTGCTGNKQEDLTEDSVNKSTVEESIVSSPASETWAQQSETGEAAEAENLGIEETELLDLEQYFEGINGCAVFYDYSNGKQYVYNQELSAKQSSPCSTFKIVSSLLGLEHGVIDPEDSVYQWNGTTYWKKDWNRDIGFKDAFQSSCVWYFREVINRLGEDTVADGLELLSYGNCDISDWEGRLNTNNSNRDLTGFWVESSLKISPEEQVKVLAEIFEGEGKFKKDMIDLLKDAMLIESNDGRTIYGKTGMGVKDGQCVDAWFVGMMSREDKNLYYAVRLDDPENEKTSSQKAKEILLTILKTSKY